MLYQIVVFLHVVFVFGFLLAHGVSVAVAFSLRNQRDIQRIQTLLDLSASSFPAMLLMLLGSVAFGLAAAFLQPVWWSFGWIWVSIALLVVIAALMHFLGSRPYEKVRKAAGMSEQAHHEDEVIALLAKTNPILMVIVGYGGYAVIAWLMMYKPF